MKIHEILNLSQRTYEERLIMDNYLLWCDLNSTSDQDCQKLMANAILFNWWLREWRMLEGYFRQEAEPYIGKANPKAMLKLYTETTIKIRDFYPAPILREARKTNILCKQENQYEPPRRHTGNQTTQRRFPNGGTNSRPRILPANWNCN
jgi:hypothetical protein